MIGYEITQQVKELSDGRVLCTEEPLYPTLHKQHADGLLKTEVVNIGRPICKYYVLTSLAKSRQRMRH